MTSDLFPRTPWLDTQDGETKRGEILRYFHATYDRYESLFETLVGDEAYYHKPISLRHPLIFYFGHTATFFTNKLVLAGLTSRINPHFESMFAVGVDEMSWDDLNDAHYDWPTVEAVRAYRQSVREMVDQVIRSTPLLARIAWDSLWWVVLMGIEHERIHLETSSVLMRQHDLKYVRPLPAWAPCPDSGKAPDNELVGIPAGHVRLGRRFDEPIYGWDNEYGEHGADVSAFQAARYLVSNDEFLAFVLADGYDDESLWDEEGRAWLKFAAPRHPTFWVPAGNDWRLRLMAQEIPMPWDWPVETNCLEARAFCRWKAKTTGLSVRLPSEDEWHRLHEHAGKPEVAAGQRADANIHLDHWASSCPVTRFRHGDLYDVVGNVWQWCETPTWPFPGFAVHPLYDDFTTPTFDDRHNIIKGGSWISCGNESRSAARYAFRRHFFQHAGFRYVVAEAPAKAPSALYESDTLLSQYAEFHYGESCFGVANFPQAMAELAIDVHRRLGNGGNGGNGKALDLGCAVGRASFELARSFKEVIGVDFSARFIQAGVKLIDEGRLRYTLVDEGELVSYRERTLQDLGLFEYAKRVSFWQGDACNLKPHLSGFDLILAANLIDRLYSPARFLAVAHERLNPGGLLVLASPYTWLEEFTPRQEWIGGFKRSGESFTTLDGLKEILGTHFNLVLGPTEQAFVIRETGRKFQHTRSEVTVWKRRQER